MLNKYAEYKAQYKELIKEAAGLSKVKNPSKKIWKELYGRLRKMQSEGMDKDKYYRMLNKMDDKLKLNNLIEGEKAIKNKSLGDVMYEIISGNVDDALVNRNAGIRDMLNHNLRYEDIDNLLYKINKKPGKLTSMLSGLPDLSIDGRAFKKQLDSGFTADISKEFELMRRLAGRQRNKIDDLTSLLDDAVAKTDDLNWEKEKLIRDTVPVEDFNKLFSESQGQKSTIDSLEGLKNLWRAGAIGGTGLGAAGTAYGLLKD